MKKIIACGLAAAAVLLSGCVEIEFQEAISAGIYDFISGTVTELLAGLVPIARG